MANIHPFFSGIDVNNASSWTLEFLTNNVISTTTSLTTKPEIIISEGSLDFFPGLMVVGWPSGGGSVNSSVAGISEMQYFLNHFLSDAKNANVSYYYFEGYDEPWKVIYNTATAQYEDKWVCSALRKLT
jgi:exo-beta-1,3-glucanase (GH17 family)